MIEETPEEAEARRRRNQEKLAKRLAHLPVVPTTFDHRLRSNSDSSDSASSSRASSPAAQRVPLPSLPQSPKNTVVETQPQTTRDDGGADVTSSNASHIAVHHSVENMSPPKFAPTSVTPSLQPTTVDGNDALPTKTQLGSLIRPAVGFGSTFMSPFTFIGPADTNSVTTLATAQSSLTSDGTSRSTSVPTTVPSLAQSSDLLIDASLDSSMFSNNLQMPPILPTPLADIQANPALQLSVTSQTAGTISPELAGSTVSASSTPPSHATASPVSSSESLPGRPPGRRRKRYNEDFTHQTTTFRVREYRNDTGASAQNTHENIDLHNSKEAQIARQGGTFLQGLSSGHGAGSRTDIVNTSSAMVAIPHTRIAGSVDSARAPPATSLSTRFRAHLPNEKLESGSNANTPGRTVLTPRPVRQPVSLAARAPRQVLPPSSAPAPRTASRPLSPEFTGWSAPQPDEGYHPPEHLNMVSSTPIASARGGRMRSHSATPALSISQPASSTSGTFSTVQSISLLIEDRRGSEVENQFVEMTVDLFPRADGTPGYMVEAQQVCAQLQDGAGRIDGHAKMFAMRDKYKQYFLRVLGDTEKCDNVRLLVDASFSLRLGIESLNNSWPMSQSQALVPRSVAPGIPGRHSRHQSYDQNVTAVPSKRGYSAELIGEPGAYEMATPAPLPDQPYRSNSPERALKRYRTNEPERHVRFHSVTPPTSTQTATTAHDPGDPAPPSLEPETVPQRSISAPPSEQDVDKTIVQWLTPLIQEDPEWKTASFERKTRKLTVAEQLRQFRFVQKQIGIYERTRTPADLEGAANRRIRKRHVLEALRRDEAYARETALILYLTRLYGPNGEYYEDPRIVRLATTEYQDGDEVSPLALHDYLRLLADIDKKWMEEHPEDHGPIGSVNKNRKENAKET